MLLGFDVAIKQIFGHCHLDYLQETAWRRCGYRASEHILLVQLKECTWSADLAATNAMHAVRKLDR